MTKTFRDLGVDPALCEALEAQGIIHPFPIQELTLPLALGRNDLIAQARTGTGKTLGFGLPLLQQIDPDLAATQALVIVPTRELCQQVHSDLTIGETRGLTTISVYGGVGFDEQIAALQSGVHVVVGTPGRLLDHLKRGNLDLSQVKVLVLDEADEMLDMGFLPDVERLIEACPPEGRHTMLFSATMPTVIVKMARRYLSHPTFMRADTEEHETAPNVSQYFFSVHRMDKPRVLARILQSPDRGGCYVFVRTKHMADRLVNDLEDLGVPAIAIHGDLRQQTREKNLDRFRSGKADVLVATEVAARGIDVTGVTHVVNYDCPDDQKMYLHRIGRTARAGNEGVAVTFAEFNEADRLNVIRKAVGATDTEVHQIFSTSPLLTELFDLPDERPWDHLAKSASSRSGGGRDSGRGGSGDKEGGRKPAPRKGRSDGRPKSRRDSEGSGRDRDAARPKDRDREPEREPRAAAEPRPSRETKTVTETTDDTAARPARQRERTRTRSRADGQDGGNARRRSGAADAAGNDASADERTDTRDADTRDSGTTTSASGRTRARSAGRKTSGTASGEARSSRNRGSGSSDAGRDTGGRDREDERGSRQSSGRTRASDDSGKDGGSRGAGGGRGSGNSRNKSSSRGGSGRSGSGSGRSSSGGGQRQARDPEPTPGVRPAPRGAEARGDGEPQLARRVKVEHLP